MFALSRREPSFGLFAMKFLDAFFQPGAAFIGGQAERGVGEAVHSAQFLDSRGSLLRGQAVEWSMKGWTIGGGKRLVGLIGTRGDGAGKQTRRDGKKQGGFLNHDRSLGIQTQARAE